MSMYNVEFISDYWNMATSVVTDSSDEEYIIACANELIYTHCGFSPTEYASVDINVDYIGE